MQTAGPYRLQRPLSTCDVGDVWSGVDSQGHSVTVAVLNARASADERWRGAFTAAAEALGGAGADHLPITNADHDAARPWVACAVEPGLGAAQIFMALGQQMAPVAPAAGDVPGGPAAQAPISGAPTGAGGQPPTGAGAHAAVADPDAGTPAAADRAHHTVPAPQPVSEPVPSEPARDVHQDGVSPWELPPTTHQPAGPPAPSPDDRTQPMPLIPRQMPADPGPAAGTAGPHPVLRQTSAPAEHPWTDAGHPPQATGPVVHAAPAVGGGPQQISGAGGSMPVSAHPFPVSADPFPVSGGPETWQRSRIFGDQPPPRPRRNLLLLACVALAALLAGAGGAVAVMAARGGDDEPAPRPTQAAPLTPEQLLFPATGPAAQGVEPPQGGGWPSSWPVFRSSESTKPINGMAGLGFDFRVPPGWSCTKQGQAEAAVRYRCGGGDEASGGDLVVRTCEPVCDEAKRTQLRQREEAWGLRWTRSGPFTTWAETTEIDGKRLYGLVYVAFWRSVPEGQIDRQLVLRMTTPLATSDDLKKVANSIRDSTFTL